MKTQTEKSHEMRSRFRFRSQKQPSEAQSNFTSRTPTPRQPPKRRSGRLLIAGLMFAACAGGLVTVWDSLLRYKAYGVVTGKIVEVAAPIDGVLRSVLVREGEEVRQDSQLATVFDLEYEQKLSRVQDELQIAQAALNAEIAKVRWQTKVQETEMTKSLADFYEGAGLVHETTGQLGVIRNELERTQVLIENRAARETDLKSQTILEEAHEQKLETVQDALRVLKTRAEQAASIPRLGEEQVAPLVAKVDMLLNETERIRQWIAQGNLRAPVSGKILHRHRPAGECVKSHEPLFSVIEDSSLEIELYLPQEMTADYDVGDTIELSIEPFDHLVPCQVTAIGTEHRKPPSNIEVFYRKDVRLLPIRVRPPAKYTNDRRLSVGAVAKLPHFPTRS